IAKRLDEMGIKPRSSNVWHPNSIRMILINETYAGLNYYAKTQILKDGRQVPRPKEEWIPIDVPHLALVDRATFDAAQVRARRNQEFAKRNRKHEYLLVGHIRCASCKLAMYGFRKWDGAVPYYRCASYNNKIAVCWHRKRSVKMRKADEAVWKWLTSLLMDEEALLAGVHDMSEKREEELEPKRERYGYVVKILNTTSEKIQRMVDELADFEGETVKIAIKEKIRQLESEQKLLFEEKEKLEEDLAALEISPNLENRILEISANVRGNLPAATFEDMRDLL
ncbi:MAG: recombinase family protein, partial [Anaerolineales bacterium]|nr:recombinase family protein [Anaerolineales bacterium]